MPPANDLPHEQDTWRAECYAVQARPSLHDPLAWRYNCSIARRDPQPAKHSPARCGPMGPYSRSPLAVEPVLEVGSFGARHCGGIARRAFLQAGALALGGLALPARTIAAEAAKAKSIVGQVVWLWGGPSQLDTFDPKPHAPTAYRGPFSTIGTRTPGVRFCELLPRLAQLSHRVTSLSATSNRNPCADHHSWPPRSGCAAPRLTARAISAEFRVHRRSPSRRLGASAVHFHEPRPRG